MIGWPRRRGRGTPADPPMRLQQVVPAHRVEPIIEHAHNCLCVVNFDGSCRAVELRCVTAYLVDRAR